MLHKRKFGKKGMVAVLMHGDAYADKELMGRLDSAAIQFGIIHSYAFDFFMSKHSPWTKMGYLELVELAGQACHGKYNAIITVGPEATQILNQTATLLRYKRMIVSVDSWAAIDNNAPHQFEMVNMDSEFYEHTSNLIRVCLEQDLSQEEGVEYIKKYEQSRQSRDWGLFDDCYVIFKSRQGAAQVVRFEDKDDVIIPPPPEHPFVGRSRVILFQA